MGSIGARIVVSRKMGYVIGVDFDNTIASCDGVIYSEAVERGLIRPDVRKTKKDIRDWIRQLPDGDIEWQRLQAVAYGPRMEEAILIDGVKRFFDSCKQHNIKVLIVSHKTEFANFDQTRTNLRLAALSWMRRKRFFEADALGLPEEDVYFESTRREKIKRIECLGCTHFIDDLEEIFLEDSFPTYVKKILYSPHAPVALADVMALTTWQEINHYFFDGKS